MSAAGRLLTEIYHAVASVEATFPPNENSEGGLSGEAWTTRASGEVLLPDGTRWTITVEQDLEQAKREATNDHRSDHK